MTKLDLSDREAVQAELVRILAEEVGGPPDWITPQARLVDDLGLDSLTAIMLGDRIEDALQVRLDIVDLMRARTVQDLLEVISRAS